MMIDTLLLENATNYGVAGIFIVYLMFDRQTTIKRLLQTMDRLNETVKKNLEAVTVLIDLVKLKEYGNQQH